MRDLSPEEREALGLSADARLEDEGVARGPPAGVAMGLAAVEMATFDEVLAKGPVYAPEDAFGQRLARTRTQLWRHDVVRGVFAIEWPSSAHARCAGRARRDADRINVDARQGAAVVRLSSPDFDILLDFQGADVYLISVPGPRSLGAVPRPPDASAMLERPDLDAIACGLALPAWLRDAARTGLDRGDALGYTMAAGAIARLWSPVTREDLAGARALAQEGAGPTANAVAWWRRCDDEAKAMVERLGILEIAPLHDEFDDLRRCVVAGDLDARRALRWLHARDDLESAAFLVASTSSAGDLARALQDLDHTVAPHHTIWVELPLADDPRLRAVAWQEPDAWWGRLAGSGS